MKVNNYKKIQSLKYLKYRKQYGEFLLEGKRLVQTALDCKTRFSSVFCTDHFKNTNETWIKNLIEKQIVPVIISSKKFEKISFTKSPSGIGAVCKIPKQYVLNLKTDRWLYLDRISDPGNMGTLMRSAAWFGLKNIALSSKCVDPYNPKVVRAGMGAHFKIVIHYNIQLKKFHYTHKIVAGDHRGQIVKEFKFPKKCVLVLGNEAHGLREKNQQYIDHLIGIKKKGVGESLNVASAGSILMYFLSDFNNT